MASFTVDPKRSRAEFAVRHMMVTTVRGEIPVLGGEVEWDPANPSAAKVVATLDPSRIATRDDARDTFMRGDGGLDVRRFPKIEFASNEVRERKGKLELRGKLTIKGVTRDVVLQVEVGRSEATATTTLDRRDYGVTFGALEAGGTLVGHELKVTVRVALVC